MSHVTPLIVPPTNDVMTEHQPSTALRPTGPGQRVEPRVQTKQGEMSTDQRLIQIDSNLDCFSSEFIFNCMSSTFHCKVALYLKKHIFLILRTFFLIWLFCPETKVNTPSICPHTPTASPTVPTVMRSRVLSAHVDTGPFEPNLWCNWLTTLFRTNRF